MHKSILKADLNVAAQFVDFIEGQALPGSGIAADQFWQALSDGVKTFGPRNQTLLERRTQLQHRLDEWHLARKDQPHDPIAYEAFLLEIGYIEPLGDDFTIKTDNIDPEIGIISGPQLVVPVMNARYALNAANARWGSLYDALYGTDAIGTAPKPGPYDPERGQKVILWGREFLDSIAPLPGASWREVRDFSVQNGVLYLHLISGSSALAQPHKFAGYTGDPEQPSSVFLRNNGLHIEIIIDTKSPIGAADRARISDIRMESAISAIMDCEDSVAAVDADDKVLAYSNWLGLMKGTLSEDITKGDQTFTRKMHDDRPYLTPDGSEGTLKARALMLVRNVGHLMTTPTITYNGQEIGEGLLDAYVTVLCAMHDLQKTQGLRNSTHGSIYVVKPKMHGSQEVALACDIFSHVEASFGLSPNTVKIGIMDEERRMSVNLKEAIRVAKHRIAFINTGFLDRTGDELHSSIEAGPMVAKGAMKAQEWITAYENRNVDIGLACGLKGHAQIGKGMWAAPDLMHDMLEQKIAHPNAGASCAWVPSPTAATLHATHYHRVDVRKRQDQIAAKGMRNTLGQLLTLPLADQSSLTPDMIQAEVENNVQGILGYVVRWVDQGIGCSKVPDIHNIALMEDRATCRISSQALANWLQHGVITPQQVEEALQKMAQVVDGQNQGDPLYTPMAPGFDGLAYLAARDLALLGRDQPSGYTEPLLHSYRLRKKAEA